MNSAEGQGLLSVVRSVLIALGSLLTAKGYVDSDTVNQIIGGVMVLLPAIWGVWDKYQIRSSNFKE